MRVIEQNMMNAINNGKNWNGNNTSVEHRSFNGEMHTYVYLFGNMIADITKKELFVSHCGWANNTTKSRLNVIIGELINYQYGITQKNWTWFIITKDGAKPFNGTYTFKR